MKQPGAGRQGDADPSECGIPNKIKHDHGPGGGMVVMVIMVMLVVVNRQLRRSFGSNKA